jgi:hypothetical protein
MSDTTFPVNIANVLAAKLLAITGVDNVKMGELAATDANGTCAVLASSWRPVESGNQGGWQIGVPEPMGKYLLTVSTLVKNGDRDQGRAASAQLAKSIRVMLYRDTDLAVQLAQLTETLDGYTERVTRSKVFEQQFLDGGQAGVFVFASVTQLDVYTEIL